MAAADNALPITIKEDGKDVNLFVVNADWFQATGSGTDLHLPHNGRSYLSTTDSMTAHGWYTPDLLGGSIEFDADLSQSGCSCNTSVYLLRMPAFDESGKPTPGEGGDFYCDAVKQNGYYCPDFDIMEANQYAYWAFPKTCDAPYNFFYSECDHVGQCHQKNMLQDPSAYGPGKRIDTTKPFHVKQDYGLLGFTTTLTQGEETFVMNSDCESYWPDFTGDLQAGMTMVFSNWSGDDYETMAWLDGDTGCTGLCNNEPSLGISNISITTGNLPPVAPRGDYTFTDACQSEFQDDCNGCTGLCQMSYPTGDPEGADSADAHCRCNPSSTQFLQ